ncbi:MAG: M48 family metallopeptidase [Desulfocurvus sp.]|nr:M48 family metallopeptidase [Desulfocurvus sp.]MCK9239587.1 M48 family metallopeptidase [Desulfocurvus sp.]
MSAHRFPPARSLRALPTALAVLALVAALAACATAPYTGRSQFILVSAGQEARLGAEAAKEVLAKEKISTDKAKIERVRRIGGRIAAASQAEQAWEFHVVENDEIVNAFALPGGKVFVYTGLMRLARSDDELAAVVGHEVAHVTLRHGAERMSQSLALGLGEQLALTLYGGSSAGAQAFKVAYGIGANVGVLLPYSRTHEYEADRVGLVYMAKAGYEPGAALDFWGRMLAQSQASGGKRPPEFLSTHPATEKRMEAIRAMLPEARAHLPAKGRPAPAAPAGTL